MKKQSASLPEHLEVLHAFLFQFQASFEQMFDDVANVTQVGTQKQALEVCVVRYSERPGAGDIGFEGFNIHQKRLNVFINSSAKLTQNVESAVVQIGPEVNGCCFRKQAQGASNSRGWVAVSAKKGVFRGSSCMPRLSVLMEGSEIFDAQNGIGADRLKSGCLRGGEAHGWSESTQVYNLTVIGGELPIAR